jgi:hypothetical protein
MRSLFYIQFIPFPTYYLALIVTDADFYALINVKIIPASSWRTLGGSAWRRYVDAAWRREHRRQHGSQGLEVRV